MLPPTWQVRRGGKGGPASQASDRPARCRLTWLVWATPRCLGFQLFHHHFSTWLPGAGDKFTQLSRLEDRLWVKVEASQRFWQGLPSNCSPATRNFVPISISTGLHQSIPLNCRCHGEASPGSAPVSPCRCIPGGHGGSPMAAAAEGLQLATLSGRGWTRLAIVVWFCNPQNRMVKSM